MSKSALRINLMAIKSHLERYFPNFALVFDRASPFYTLHDYFFGRHSMRLLIQIQIPLTAFQHDFTVYEVIKFPVPVTGRPTYNTFLPNLPRYFVTSRHSDFYFTLENDDTKRHPKLLYLTDSRISFNSFNTGATYLSALFRNNITQVRELCSFQLQEIPLEPKIHFLSNSRILLTTVSEIAIKCGTKDSIFQGCTQCIRNCQVTILAPNSSVASRTWPPKISTCRYDVNVTKIQHIINLAALQSFLLMTH